MHNGLAGKNTTADKGGGSGGRGGEEWEAWKGSGSKGGEGGEERERGVEEEEEMGEEDDYSSFRTIRHSVFSLPSECPFISYHFVAPTNP